ncbi:MAG: hypothetical protein L3J63_02060 [Geopsychrobacter sp.]|nr:hypothetical protein [Geopsychrobacter sp.]
MTCAALVKSIQVAFYRRVPAVGCNWRDPCDWAAAEEMLVALAVELRSFQIELTVVSEQTEIAVRGYGDILNAIRLRYPTGGFANTCLGHVIGSSPNRDLATDLKRGINRLLFAPETVEPQGSDKVICHNCGCGC